MLPNAAETLPPLIKPTSGWMSAHRWAHLRDLLVQLIGRDMKLRYRGSVFGMAWTLLNPLAELLVLMFVFTAVLPMNIPNFAAFLFTGLLAYGWFQTALTFATGAIVHNRELIRRPSVPTAILPVVTVASTFIHFLLSLPVLAALILWSGVRPSGALLLLPVVIGVEFLLILSLSYPLAVLHVWLRDTQYMLRVVLQLLFYLTPVFYEPSAIPERFRGVYFLNPMVSVVEAYRDVLVRGRVPALAPLLSVTVVSLILLAGGVRLFKSTSHRFSDEL